MLDVAYELYHSTNLIPERTSAEIENLAIDIQENGLREPIVLYENKLLDGRARVQACVLADLPLALTIVPPDEIPTLRMLRLNIHSRGLTSGQRAMIGAQAEAFIRKEIGSRRQVDVVGRQMREELADILKIGYGTLWDAEQVLKMEPGAVGRVMRLEESAWAIHARHKVKPTEPPLTPTEQVRKMVAGGAHDTQIAKELGLSVKYVNALASSAGIMMPHRTFGKHRRLDVNRIIDQTVAGAQNVAAGLDMVEGLAESIDTERIPEWVESLRTSINWLNQLIRQLQKRKGNL